MALKRTRTEKLNQLENRVSVLKTTVDAASPKERTLIEKIDRVKEAVAQLEDAHNKFISDEKTTADEKAEANEEYLAAIANQEEVLEPAEDKLELLQAADEIPPDQQKNLQKERIRRNVVQQKEKIQVLKTNLEAMTNPNKAQLDRLHDMADQTRKEVRHAMEESYAPLYITSPSSTESLDLDAKLAEDLKPMMALLDDVEKLIVDKTTDSPVVPSVAPRREGAAPETSTSSAYKFYQKHTMPKFDGAVKNYPKWKREFVQSILPGIEDCRRVRLLDEHTPDNMDLQNCEKVEDAWDLLDAKYGNKTVISAALLEEFFKLFSERKNTRVQTDRLEEYFGCSSN